MKPIPRSYIMEFSARLNDVSQTAKAKMRQALYEVDLSDMDAARAQISDIMEMVVGASDAMASTMAASFYDGIREYQTGAALGATADSGWEPDSTKRATYGITDRLAKAETPDVSMVEGLLTQRIGYEVKRSAGRTMYANGRRDPNRPKFARIPMGGDSCEFCRMLASRGFEYNSEKSAGKHNPDHYHDGCRCEVVCSWDKDPRIAGLSEEEYNHRAYGEHRDAYKSWASKDHSQHEQHQKEKRRNRYTEDGRLKAGYSGERIDKQAAYTEADRKKVAARAAAQRGNTQRGTKRVSQENGVVKASRDRIHIAHSAGAAFYARRVKDIDGKIINLEVDTDIEDIEVIAGRGHRRKIDDIKFLQKKYGGAKDDWQKVKGVGKVKVNGMVLDAELHWYEMEFDPMTYEIKVVRYLYDES